MILFKYKYFIHYFFSLLFFIISPSPLLCEDKKDYKHISNVNNINKDDQLSIRPRLYLNAYKIKLITTKNSTYPYSKFWKVVKEKANQASAEQPQKTNVEVDEDNLWKLGDGSPHLALSYLITGNQAHLDGARKWMNALCSYPDWASNKDMGAAALLFDMSIAYDWLHGEFTPEELNRYSQKMTKHANILHQSLIKKDMWWARPEYQMQGHNYLNVMAIAIAGIALRGERPEADLWLAAAKDNFDGVLSLLSPDGASHEGVGYWGGGADWLLRYFLANPMPHSQRDIEKSKFFQNTARFRLYASTPDYVEVADYADSPRYEWVGPGYILRALASVFKDGRAQWLAERIEQARGKDAKYSWLDLIWYDETVRPIPPTDLPTYAFFDNLGIFIRRSDWTEQAAWSFFKAGPSQGKLAESKEIYTGSHIHPDEGSFLLWAHGQWLITDDGYVYKKRTENHNVLIFNNIGQLGEGQQWFNPYPVKQYKGTASIDYSNLQTDYQYVTAELAKMYPPEARVNSWKRTFIALPRGRMIIQDRVVWEQPNNTAYGAAPYLIDIRKQLGSAGNSPSLHNTNTNSGKVVSRIHLRSVPQMKSSQVVCLGSKEGLAIQSLLPQNALLKIGHYMIAENERVRSTNSEGGLLEIEDRNAETFLLFVDPRSGGCDGNMDDLTASPSGDFLEIKSGGEVTVIDFNKKSVTIQPH